jgi:rhamnosyltransferase
MNNTVSALPQVAVLMATYNGEKFIKQQVDSILQQKNVQVSLFVRDDHSTDNTVAIIQSYKNAGARVCLMDQKPTQLKVTKNFFSMVKEINLAEFDYIAYSDQDDIWLDNKLHAAITAIKQNKASCYASNLLRGDADGNIVTTKSILSKISQYLLNYKSNNQKAWDYYFEAASAGCTLVLNKEAAAYFQKRLYDIYENIPADASHDWSTYAITKIGGFNWYIDNHAYIIYRQHSANAYGVNNGMKGISKLVELFTSGWYRRHILLIDALYNNTDNHPAFMNNLHHYQPTSITGRFQLAFAISGHRRKPVHRILLFGLIIFGYFR